MWLNACGKLPSSSPVLASTSSASRPTSLANVDRRARRSRARRRLRRRAPGPGPARTCTAGTFLPRRRARRGRGTGRPARARRSAGRPMASIVASMRGSIGGEEPDDRHHQVRRVELVADPNDWVNAPAVSLQPSGQDRVGDLVAVSPSSARRVVARRAGRRGRSRGRAPPSTSASSTGSAGARRGPPRCPGPAPASGRPRRRRDRRGSRAVTDRGARAGREAGGRRRAARRTRRAGVGSMLRCRPAPARCRASPERWRSSRSVRSCSPPIPNMIWRSPPPRNCDAAASAMKSKNLSASCGARGDPERLQREARVAHPRVAVVPVARAAGRLGQRRRRRGADRAGREVRQRVEHPAAVVARGRATGRVVLVQARPGAPRDRRCRRAALDLALRPAPRRLLRRRAVVQRERRGPRRPARVNRARRDEIRRPRADGRRQRQHVGPAPGRTPLRRPTRSERRDEAVLGSRRVLELHLDSTVDADEPAQDGPTAPAPSSWPRSLRPTASASASVTEPVAVVNVVSSTMVSSTYRRVDPAPSRRSGGSTSARRRRRGAGRTRTGRRSGGSTASPPSPPG